MKLYKCQECSNLIYFENVACEVCGHKIGYLPEQSAMTAVEREGANWVALADPGNRYRFCANWEKRACNWMMPVDSPTTLCRACQHNRIIPDLADSHRHALWIKLETAKRRLFYSLMRMHLPMPTPASGDTEPLVFDFLGDHGSRRVVTGHHSGLITISLKEADDSEREAMRTSMHEPYRTLLGHFRHEVGHFYWDKLVRDGNRIEEFRQVFGDERADYQAAMQAYYANGPAPDWQVGFVSGYAAMHPWEDFAESWAHYLHIVDTLETARAFGVRVDPPIDTSGSFEASVEQDPYTLSSIGELLSAWLPITFAVNSLNRAMGQPDLYPFVISPPAAKKLDFIRMLVQEPQTGPHQI
jgi:hypothetical protein